MINLLQKAYTIPKDDKRPGPDNIPGKYYYVDKETGKIKVLLNRASYDQWYADNLFKIELKKLLRASGAPLDKFYTFKDYIGDKSSKNIEVLRNFVEAYDDIPSNVTMYFYGTNNSQKTTTALATAGAIIKKGIVKAKYNDIKGINGYLVKNKVKYINFKDLLNLLITSSIEMDNELRKEAIDELNEIRKVDLLIVDEAFDESKSLMAKSGFQTSFIDDFVRTYDKHIIYISNVAPENISPKFGDQTKIHLERKICKMEFLDLIDNGNKVFAAPDLDTLNKLFKTLKPKVRRGKTNE